MTTRGGHDGMSTTTFRIRPFSTIPEPSDGHLRPKCCLAQTAAPRLGVPDSPGTAGAASMRQPSLPTASHLSPSSSGVKPISWAITTRAEVVARRSRNVGQELPLHVSKNSLPSVPKEESEGGGGGGTGRPNLDRGRPQHRGITSLLLGTALALGQELL